MARARGKAGRARVVGRKRERATVRTFLSDGGRVLRVLLIPGEPGIGKTTLWLDGVAAARETGWTILVARPAEPEQRLSYGVLRDLLGGMVADVDPARVLPDVQLAALRMAIEGGNPDETASWLAVAAATTALLRSAAASGLLVAIDDVQWADEASMRVLEFALRRLRTEQIAVLATHRLEMPADREVGMPFLRLDPASLPVGPMSEADLATVVRLRIGSLPDEALRRLHAESGANPFVALEMARTLSEHPGSEVPGGRMRISIRLRQLTSRHLSALTDAGLEVALLASALTEATTERLVLAGGARARIETGLANAERVGILEPHAGRWRFTHPLLAAAVYDSAGPGDRRALHARLAAITEEPEEKAWHLALSAIGPNEEAAEALTAAARAANARGAPDSALAMLREALRLTDPARADEAARRSVEAARCMLVLDRPRDALGMLGPALRGAIARDVRASALRVSGLAALEVHGPFAAADFAARALRVTTDPMEKVLTAERYADLLPAIGGHARIRSALRSTVRHAQATGTPALIARARINELVDDFQSGRRTGASVLRMIERLAKDLPPTPFPARMHAMVGQVAHWADEPAIAREHWGLIIANAAAVGDELQRAEFLGYLADLDVRTGSWGPAVAAAAEALDLAIAAEGPIKQAHALCIEALVSAARGDFRQAAAKAVRGSELASEYPWLRWRNLAVLGFVELSQANFRGAAARYEDAVAIDAHSLERRQGACYLAGDWIESEAGAGRPDHVRDALARLEDQAATWRDGWTLAGAARARAAVLRADAQLGPALVAATEAVDRHRLLPYPFERGRSLLMAGSIHRRLTHRREARALLSEALGLFNGLDAHPWMTLARAELNRVGGRAPSIDVLTPSESAVADLVALGLSNAQVAERLVLATRTIESHLTQIYAKLGVRTRSELVRQQLTGGKS